MAPVEFEKHIREKFEERRIEPSTDSWDKISGQLELPAQGRKTFFNWYSIAAAIAGVLLAVTWMFNSGTNTDVEGDAVVESPGIEVKGSGPSTELPETQNSGAVVASDAEADSAAEVVHSDPDEALISQQEVARVTPDQRSVLEPVSVEQDLIIDNKISEIVAQVSLLELDSAAITDAEVDSLLMGAQREILADKNFRQASTVDANALLADVEIEIDKSFRDQVFEKLKEGFIKVRTAVADRNK